MSEGEVERVYEKLVALCELVGPSGREELVRSELVERWGPLVDRLEVDRRGNLSGELGRAGPRLAVVAHMDEIGWVVRRITPDGFLLLDSAQGQRRDGPPQRYMVGQDVVVLGRAGVVADGVIAAPSGHTRTRAQSEEPRLDWDDFFVDLGMTSRAHVEGAGVYVGSSVVFVKRTRRLGSRIVGKAMDDRMPLCVIELLLERLQGAALGCRLDLIATVHEEGGPHGAFAASRASEADFVIALDVGLVGDTPSSSLDEYPCRLSGGPTLVHKDGLIAYDHALTWALIETAERAGLPFQHGVYSNYGSDGLAFSRAGIPTALIGIPTRYTHTAFELIDPGDVLTTVSLLEALATGEALAELLPAA